MEYESSLFKPSLHIKPNLIDKQFIVVSHPVEGIRRDVTDAH